VVEAIKVESPRRSSAFERSEAGGKRGRRATYGVVCRPPDGSD